MFSPHDFGNFIQTSFSIWNAIKFIIFFVSVSKNLAPLNDLLRLYFVKKGSPI